MTNPTNLPMPTLQNLLSKEGASFSLPRDSAHSTRGGGSSDSDSDSTGFGGQAIGGIRTRDRIAKGAMPALTLSNDREGEEGDERTVSKGMIGSYDVVGAGIRSPTREDVDMALKSATGGSRPIKVIVVADVVCPWCYVALRSIQQAIQDLTLSCLSSPPSSSNAAPLSPPRFDIEFRPFFINDNFGSDEIAIDRKAFLEAKFGHKLEEHDRIVRERGEKLGIDFKFGGMLRQTTRAHRLLTLAYRTGGSPLQLALLEHLFYATHVEEKDIGNVELLAYYADKVGLLSKPTAERWLRTKDLEEDVRRLVKISVQGCGIAGVPFVVVNGKWAIGGGEESRVYQRVFERVWRGGM